MPERVAAAFDRNTEQLRVVAAELHSARTPFRILLAVSALEFLIVCLTFPSLFILKSDANNNAKTLTLLEGALSPKNQAQQAKTTEAAIQQITLCVDAHQARDTERILYIPLKPMPAGCPDVTP